MSKATDLRKAIGPMEFDYWVRIWRDGEISAAPNFGSDIRVEALAARLREIGYATHRCGKPGTGGYHNLLLTKISEESSRKDSTTG